VYASQRWFDLYLKAIFIGGKLGMLGFTLGFPIFIYADVAIVYSTIFTARGRFPVTFDPGNVIYVYILPAIFIPDYLQRD